MLKVVLDTREVEITSYFDGTEDKTRSIIKDRNTVLEIRTCNRLDDGRTFSPVADQLVAGCPITITEKFPDRVVKTTAMVKSID